MIKLRLRAFVPAAVLAAGLVFSAHAQRAARADSVSFERPNELIIFQSNSPAVAFALQGDMLWYATEKILVGQSTVAARGAQVQQHAKIGNISSQGVTSIIVDPLNRVWVGCEEGVAVRSGTSWTSYTSAEGLPDNSVTSLTAGSGGEVWVGTGKGLARFRDGSWKVFTTADGLLSDKIQALVTDARGKIYIGTNRGLNVYDGTKFESYNAKNTGSAGLEWNNVKVLAVEPKTNIIWMADGPKNINSFDGNKEWKRFREIQDGITSIMHDSHRVWFGHAGGLLRFNGEEWVDSPSRHGVPAEQVYAMFCDAKGDLWFGMDRGVMRFNNPYRR